MRRTVLISLGLLALVLAAFCSAGAYDFVGCDDPGYVTHDPMVNQGLRSAAVLWALTAPHAGNWHPLTTLSFITDCSFLGLKPGAFHWGNIGWYGCTTLRSS